MIGLSISPRVSYRQAAGVTYPARRALVCPSLPRRSSSRWNIKRSLFLLLLIVIPLFSASTALGQARTKRVLIMSTYDPGYPAVTIIMQHITSTMRDASPVRIEFFYEFQENFRIPSSKYERDMVTYLQRKYAGEEIGLVITLGASALQFVMNHESELFSGVPRIFYFHDESEATARSFWPRVTGVWADLELRKTLDIALSLHPNTRHVAVVSGISQQDKFVREEAQRQFGKYEGQLEFIDLTDLTMEELKARVATLPANTVVFYLSLFVDKAGSSFSAPEALSIFAPSSNAPIYGVSGTYLGLGIVGGSLLDFESLGRALGQIGTRVMNGENAKDIQVQTVSTVPRFDWRQLERWNIDRRKLPPNADVQFEVPSFWTVYRGYVLLVVGGLLVQTLLIIGLLITRWRRRQAQLESQRLMRVAEAEHQRLDEVVSNVPGVVWESRIDPVTRERRATFVSDYIEKMLGYTVEEWMSTPGFGLKFLYDKDRERVLREVEEILAQREGGVLQFRWLAKDGHVVWAETHLTPVLDANENIVGMRGVTLDITDQRHAEEARHQTEERNRAILEAVPDLMFLLTRDGVFLDYHVRDPKDLFVPPEQFLGRKMRDVLPPQLAEALLERFGRAEQGEPQILEYGLDTHDRHGWFEARIVLTGDNILTVVRDVTARKLVEIALKENEAQLAGIISSAMDGIITIDESQCIVLFNAAAERLFLCSAADVLGQPLDRLLPERFRAAHRQHVKNFGQQGEPRRLMGLMRELYGLRSTGEEFPIESSISQLEVNDQKFFTVILRDITEHKKSLDDLRQSEERFGKVFRVNPQPMSVTTLAEGRYIDVNESFLKMSGYSREEVIGHTSLELNVWGHPEARAAFIERVNSSDSRVNFETRFQTKDGSTRVLLSSAEKLDIAGQECLLVASSDVTERVAAEKALQVAHAELEELKNKLEAENIYLQEELKLDSTFGDIIGQSEAIKQVVFKITQVAPTDSTVLVSGETGTGKELVARAIHGASSRKDKPLIKVNCGALAPTLIESELFGHEKGAFTGAVARKLGRFELANGGTIFLDEIGELPSDLQVKLLRVIQEGEIERLGGTKTIKTDVRIIAATNRNLKLEVEKGNFREDLWYRLNVYPIIVPPLRQRKEDIPLLVEHFVNSYAKRFGKTITSVSPREMENLQRHYWPGNVRELANVIERAVIQTKGETLQVVDRYEPVQQKAATTARTLEQVEREYIVTVLENTGWRIEGPFGAAKIVGLNPSTLRTRMLKLGIQRGRANVV